MRKLQVFGVSLFNLLILIFFINLVFAVKINEVMPKTPEYVEIYNENSDILNLSKWKIKDSSNSEDSITCYNIPNCSLLTNSTYFLIIGRNTNITEITNKEITYFYVETKTIADNLNDNGDNLTFFNSTFSTNFFYNITEVNRSWQLYNGAWQICEPTPGFANFCQEKNQTDNNQNQTNQTSEIIQNSTKPETSLELDCKEEIRNGEEFKVKVKVYNLGDESYDVKVWLSFDNKTISETYNKKENGWKSSGYYINKIFSGPGNKTETFELRIKEKYRDIYGNAKIKARIRISGNNEYVVEVSWDIEVIESLEKKEINQTIIEETNQTTISREKKKEETSIIKLNNPKNIKIQENYGIEVYKSKTQLIREYAIYGFALFCVFVIIVLLIKKF